MNTLVIDDTSLEVPGHRAVEARDSAQTLSQVGDAGGAGSLGRARSGTADERAENARGPGRGLQDRGQRGNHPAPRRKRCRQGSPGRERSMPAARAPPIRWSPFTARAFPPNSWRANSSGTCRAGSTVPCADAVGKVAVAEGGTLFLNEIGDLPLALQPKLLRLLQQRCYERVGESQTRASNIRILAATNRNLEAELAAGRFLEDLYYQLNVIEVTVPPLRDRPADILPLAEHLLRFYAQQDGKSISGFAEPVRDALLRYAWPGNIRELAQRHRAGSHSRGRPGCHVGRLAVADRRPKPGRAGHRGEVAGGGRAADARADGGRAHPPHPGLHGEHWGSSDEVGYQPEHAVSETEEVWNLKNWMVFRRIPSASELFSVEGKGGQRHPQCITCSAIAF